LDLKRVSAPTSKNEKHGSPESHSGNDGRMGANRMADQKKMEANQVKAGANMKTHMQEIVAEMKADRDAHIQVKTCVKQKSD
jgi:hypothetical protein